jgi:aryl-alcohol dehydrogenase-like predicted oxidoreductase
MDSRLILGTVNMGMDYGPDKYRVSEDEAHLMLSLAEGSGLTLDTAAAYGDAEKIIGDFHYRGRINTKLPPWCEAKDVLSLINDRRKILKKDRLDAVLLHTESQIYDIYTVAALVEAKKRGYVENIGVSVYNQDIAMTAIKMNIDIIQIPFSAFDCELYFSHFFDKAKANNIKVHARSAFLQGFMLKKPKNIAFLNQIDQNWPYYAKNFDVFGQICENYGFSRPELALFFSLFNQDIDKVVIGVDNLKQLKDNLMLEKNMNCNEMANRGRDAVDDLLDQFKYLEYQVPTLFKKGVNLR